MSKTTEFSFEIPLTEKSGATFFHSGTITVIGQFSHFHGDEAEYDIEELLFNEPNSALKGNIKPYFRYLEHNSTDGADFILDAIQAFCVENFSEGYRFIAPVNEDFPQEDNLFALFASIAHPVTKTA